MKKLLLCFMLVCNFLISVSACASKHNNCSNNYYGGDPMDFKSFKLVQSDMTAQRRVYEGYKTAFI